MELLMLGTGTGPESLRQAGGGYEQETNSALRALRC